MNSKKFEWEDWIENEKKCEKAFEIYLERGLIKQETETESLSKSHLRKADYNLDFINFLVKNQKFYDWMIVGCYYAIYRASLALLTSAGYSSKKHNATLCSLIKIYYHNKKQISEEELKLIAKSLISKEEVGYFVQAKEKRESVSYGLSEEFTKQEAEELINNTILFVNKSKEILE